MSRTVALFLLSMLLNAQPALAAGNCAAREPPTRAGLLLAESRWVAALENRDVEALACRLAPEFVDTDWRGRVIDRAQVLARRATRDPTLLHLDRMTVQLFGNVGIVHGRNTGTSARGEPAGVVRFTDVFVRLDGHWRAVSAQETLVASDRPS